MSRDIDAIIKQKYAESGDVGLGGLDLAELWPIAYSTPGGSFPQRIQFNQLFRFLSALAVEINAKGPYLEYDGIDPTGPDYEIGAIVRKNSVIYECSAPNGPSSVIVDPVGNPDTWIPKNINLTFTGGGTLIAGTTNELQDGGTYILPPSDSLPENSVVWVLLPGLYSASQPKIEVDDTVTETMISKDGTDTDTIIISGEMTLIPFITNGVDQWRY